jgi:hypothetical protein
MVLAALSGGFRQFGGGSGGGSKENSNIPQNLDIKKFPEQTKQVLGATTDTISEFFSSIPLWVWITIAILVIIAIIISVLITLYIREWARASLIASLQAIDSGDTEVNLKYGSDRGRTKTAKFIKLHIFPQIIFWISVCIVGILVFLLTYLIKDYNLLFFTFVIIESLIGISFIVLGVVLLTLTIIIAEQRLIRFDESVKTSFKISFSIAKKYLFQMLGLALIHTGIGCAAGCLVAIIISIIILLVILLFTFNKTIGFVALAIISIPSLAIILSVIVVQGIFLVFKTSNWTLLVNELSENYLNQSKKKDDDNANT